MIPESDDLCKTLHSLSINHESKKMYEVNGQSIQWFTDAVAIAKAVGADVIEVATGLRRWSPAPKVTDKQMRHYRSHKSAYDAQESLKNKK